MKQRIAILLILIMLLSVFSGCKQEPVNTGTEPAQQSEHTDTDNNGLCDDCGISVLVNLDFYAVNDLHGKLLDTTTSQIGVDEMSTYLRRAYFAEENMILLSSGDMWQGSAESNLTRGLIMTDWMNELDFVAMTLGNHEFDWGEAYIHANKEIAEFPFLGINIYSRNTNSRVEYCDSSVVIEKGGIQIGIIGAMGDCYSSIASDHTKEIYFVVGDELTELVKAEAQRLRQEGVDYIVYSIHDGYGGKDFSDKISKNVLSPYYNVELSDGYVDLVFEAHTHQFYVKQDQYGVYHMQGGGDNTGISYVDVDYNIANGSSTVNNAEYIGSEKYRSFSDDPVVQDLLTKYDDQVSIAWEELGYNSQNRSSEELRQIAANLYYEKGMELWGQDYDIVLGGGFFTVRAPGFLEMGTVQYAELMMMFPFDNFLVLCSVKGRDLRDKFFETGNENYFIGYGDYGELVRQSLDPNATYYVVVDTYTSTYGPNKLTEIVRYEQDLFTRDLIAEYLRQGKME